MSQLDLTKPIQLKSRPGIACAYLGAPFGLHVVAFADGRALTYSDEGMNRIFENAPEAPWYPDDSGDWIEGGVEMLPENVATFEVLTTGERLCKSYASQEYSDPGSWRTCPVAAVKPLTVRYVKP